MKKQGSSKDKRRRKMMAWRGAKRKGQGACGASWCEGGGFGGLGVGQHGGGDMGTAAIYTGERMRGEKGQRRGRMGGGGEGENEEEWGKEAFKEFVVPYECRLPSVFSK